jgi:hypothetical protein
MRFAPWIKSGPAIGTAIVAREVARNCHGLFAISAEDRLCLKFRFFPPLNRMPLLLFMAEMARVDVPAALEA